MRKTKNAQTEHLFFYILGLIVVGLLLFFGVRAILKVREDINRVDLVQFKTELENTAEKIRTRYGSWETNDFNVPNGVKQVCFFDKNAYKDTSDFCRGTGNKPINPLMCDAWKDGTQNVMTDPFVADTSLDIGEVVIGNGEGHRCFPVIDGRITVTMTGMGDKVQIE